MTLKLAEVNSVLSSPVPRCFYFDRVSWVSRAGMPGWTLNETTDLVTKKRI